MRGFRWLFRGSAKVTAPGRARQPVGQAAGRLCVCGLGSGGVMYMSSAVKCVFDRIYKWCFCGHAEKEE